MNYTEFLKTKEITDINSGFNIEQKKLNSMLFDFQKAITQWSLKKGKSAIFADCGLGKGQLPNSVALTKRGWVKFKDLELCDYVYSSNGKAHRVKGIFPKEKIKTYKFTYSDGAECVFDLDHLHICRTNNDRQRNKKWRILSTKKLLECKNLRYGKNNKSRTYDIPIVKPIEFEKTNNYISPYILGVLLGDGYLKGNISISNADKELLGKVKKELPKGIELKHKHNYDYKIKTGYIGNRKHPFRKYLEKMDLLNKLSHEKFIPNLYLYSSINNRVELLKGLMDTDGHIIDCGTCQFYSVSKKLAEDVLFLVRSLGGIPTFKKSKSFIGKKRYRDHYTVTFSLKTFNPFYIDRKRDKYNFNPRDNGRWIDKIEYAGKQKTICISVDSPDSSYITEHCIVTHNTPIQLSWANQVYIKTKKPILIFAPLAVSKQTKREGEKFHIPVNICRKQSEIINGINITNYEMLKNFISSNFGGLVLDESSILKGIDGKFRKAITDFGSEIPYRLCCTATPSPNDIVEIINHAEFLGIMTENEIKSLFFTNRSQEQVQKWVLKGHAEKEFWRWMATWSVALRMPSDLGFDNDGFILPKLNVIQKTLKATKRDIKSGQLFAIESKTLRDRQISRRKTTDRRTSLCAELVNNSDKQWLIWCDLNYESNTLKKLIPDGIEIKGADSPEYKENSLIDFQQRKIRVLITKPSIAGFGMNLQNCHNMVFVGLSDSYEKLYQATRRCWRFGQEDEVNSYIITTEVEGAVVRNIKRKEKEAEKLFDNVIKNMNLSGQLSTKREEMIYMEDIEKGDGWELSLGDTNLTIKKIKDETVGLSIFSPPFPGMYVYSNSKHDIGNTKTIEELIDQFKFMMPEILRITIPGRICAVYLCQGIAYKHKDGFIGIKDFRGKVIEAMIESGWIYYGEVCIDKNPQLKAIRTRDVGLSFETSVKDASKIHPALADYLLQFKKPGENPEPVKAGIKSKRYHNPDGWLTNDEWIEWAAPVWYRQTKYYPGGIRETDVLSNVRQAKDNKDEKHLAPLQLGVIERAIKMWSNPSDIIYSPFAGIGSEGYVALKLNRKFVGCELKKSYFDVGIKNLKSVTNRSHKLNLAQVR